jgi:uncharacterized membrane protein (DUF373 family)
LISSVLLLKELQFLDYKFSSAKYERIGQNMEKIISITINTLIILLTVIMAYSMLEIVLITIRTIFIKSEILNFLNPTIDRNNLFVSSVQGFVAAALLITILIEVIESLREYKLKNKINYTKVIVEIAIIAVIRHVLILDYEHTSTGTLVGISSLIFVLGSFYLILTNKISVRRRDIYDE